MRFLDTDIDLILSALTVVFIAWAVEPPKQPPADVPITCVETACYPTPLVLP